MLIALLNTDNEWYELQQRIDISTELVYFNVLDNI